MKTMKKFAVTIVVLLGLLTPSIALAQSPDTGNTGWRFDLAPFYLWAAGLEGDVSLGTGSGISTAPIDVAFDDVFSNLESIFILHLEAAKDNRWGFFLDYNYLDISGDHSLPLNVTMSVDFKASLFELAGFYRFSTAPQHDFDVFLGVRYSDLEPSISFSGPLGLGAEGEQDWLDPFVGLRWRWSFTDQLQLSVRGDVGGFGVGSDFSWKAAALLYWQPFKHVGFMGGYQGLYQDYEDGSGRDYFKYDVTMHGPILGINFTW